MTRILLMYFMTIVRGLTANYSGAIDELKSLIDGSTSFGIVGKYKT